MTDPIINDLMGSDMVFKTDNWTRYQFNEHQKKDEPTREAMEAGAEKVSTFPRFTREVFTSLYNDATPSMDPVSPEHAWAAKARAELEANPQWKGLQNRCRGDRFLAGVSAAALVQGIAEALPAAPPEMSQDVQALRQEVKELLEYAKQPGLTPEERAKLDKMIADKKAQGKAAVEKAQAYAQGIDPNALCSSVVEAIQGAQEAAEGVEAACYSFGSFGGGSPTVVDPALKQALMEAVRNNPTLQKIALAAGRMKTIAARKQKTRADHGRDEVVGVTLGANLESVLPAELMLLHHPVARLDFKRRFVEGQLMQFETIAVEPQGKGPIIALVDSSGSMEGERHVWAMALCLALLDIAVKQRRDFRLVHFTATVRATHDFTPGNVDPMKIIEAVGQFFGGGTEFDPPLEAALEAITTNKRLQKADVVMVTDGISRVSDEVLAKWNAAKVKHGFTCYALHIGGAGGVPPQALASFANPIVGLADVASDDNATDAVLTI